MKRVAARVLFALWLAAAVVIWNSVFDARVVAGARDYVERQTLFVKGQGPRADMDAVMRGAVASGARRATLYSLFVVAPGVAFLFLRRRGRPDSRLPTPDS
jgi:hypothetical protein